MRNPFEGDAKAIETWRGEAVARVDDAVAKAQREGAPDPYTEDWCAISSRHLSEGRNDATG